jgi:oligopeptide transport system permease protein
MSARGGDDGRWDLGGRDLEVLLEEARKYKGESLWQDAWRRLKANRSAYVSLILVVLIGGGSLFAPLFPFPSPTALALQLEPQPPVAPWDVLGRGGWTADEFFDTDAATGERTRRDGVSWLDAQMVRVRAAVFGDWQTGNWLGTDAKGRDVLARIVWGSRVSIQVGLVATLCSLIIGVTYGALAGLLGGRVDNAMMRLVDILYSIPFIFLVIFVLTLIMEMRSELEDHGIEFMHVFYVILGAIYWLTMARVVRGQVLSLKNSEFIEAARVLGASTRRILFVHLMPNVLSVVIVYLTLTIPAVMLFEAFISFLGLGVQPPEISWGLLAVASVEAINPVHSYWWEVVWIALAMGVTLLALNVLGDGVRDALDPKLRGRD